MIVLLESVHPDAHAMLASVDEVQVMADPLVVAGLQRGDKDKVRAMLTRGRGRITAAMYDEFPELAVVGRCGAGLDNIDVDEAAARGIAVVYAPGATTAAVSEHAVMLMLAVARRIGMLDTAVKHGRWSVRDGYTGTELRAKRLGVVGFGAIGHRVAELGRAFDMDVVYWNRSPRPEPGSLGLDELLASSDVVQLCVALTPETRHLLDERRIGLMRPDALVVNTSRGAVVDHGALRAAITSGRLGGYATDVWDPEPPSGEDDLAPWGDRLVVTPHVAAITDVTYRDICVRTASAALAALGHPVT